MQVTETAAEGLSRTFQVTVPRTDLAEKLAAKIEEIRPQVRLKGFRPGMVPASHIKKMFGKSIMGDIVEELVSSANAEALQERELRPAGSPEIDLKSDVDKVMAGDDDLVYEMKVEIMPKFDVIEPKTISIERPVSKATEAEVNAALERIAADQKIYASRAKTAKAKDGDSLIVDYVGSVDGVDFEGGAADDAEIVLGAGRLIPGFEDQLIGAKAGDDVDVNVTFPDDYPNQELKGSAAMFKVRVKDVRAPKDAEVDDDLAKRMGFEDLAKLREAVKTNLEREFAAQSRQRAKRRLLDKLDDAHDFELPARMVEIEFDTIWRQIAADKAADRLDPEDQGKSDDELKAEYRKIAERRVRLGLVLAELGRESGVEVSEEELARAINMEARRHPGQEAQIAKFFRENAGARAQLRAPIYEEKVVDYIFELCEIKDVDVSRDELFTDD